MNLHLQPYFNHTLVPQPIICGHTNGPGMLLDHNFLCQVLNHHFLHIIDAPTLQLAEITHTIEFSGPISKSNSAATPLSNPQLKLQIYLLCICYIPIINKLQNKNKEIAHFTQCNLYLLLMQLYYTCIQFKDPAHATCTRKAGQRGRDQIEEEPQTSTAKVSTPII